LWNIAPIGDPVRDSIILELGWRNPETGGIDDYSTRVVNGNVFAAKWENGQWVDYRRTLATYVTSATNCLNNSLTAALNKYPVANSEALTGTWAVFAANNNTDGAKDSAITTNLNKLVITDITPNPVVTGINFKVTIALQDQFGQPVKATTDLPLLIKFVNGGALKLDGEITGGYSETMPAGKSEKTIQLMVNPDETVSDSPIAQLQVTADSNWLPGISQFFPVLPAQPTDQAYDVQFSRITYTTATVRWTMPESGNVILVAKAGSLLDVTSELPLGSHTYVPNTVYGAGSTIGNAVVLYNDTALANGVHSVDISGLLPNTEYYVYAFAYTGNKGNENYKITAAQRNPNKLTTLLGTDDDKTFGKNNDYYTSQTVGTNAPISGMINPTGDIDAFNFMVTSAAPNVRVLLTNCAGNYTLELYDFTGRRIRRSTLIGNSDEAAVVNDLPAGTYVAKVFAEDGSEWQRVGDEYKLLINTFSNEIFSVTPTP
jgi:hypothetical protein